MIFLSAFFFYRKLGWDVKNSESHLDAMLRGEVLTALVELGHDATIKEATERFSAFLGDKNTPLLPPDARNVSPLLLNFKYRSLILSLMIFIKM